MPIEFFTLSKKTREELNKYYTVKKRTGRVDGREKNSWIGKPGKGLNNQISSCPRLDEQEDNQSTISD